MILCNILIEGKVNHFSCLVRDFLFTLCVLNIGRKFLLELGKLGIDSIPLTIVISIFIRYKGHKRQYLGKYKKLGRVYTHDLKSVLLELGKLGIDSIPLTIVISIFIGAVICIQMQLNMTSPVMPAYSTGLATRDSALSLRQMTSLCLLSLSLHQEFC